MRMLSLTSRGIGVILVALVGGCGKAVLENVVADAPFDGTSITMWATASATGNQAKIDDVTATCHIERDDGSGLMQEIARDFPLSRRAGDARSGQYMNGRSLPTGEKFFAFDRVPYTVTVRGTYRDWMGQTKDITTETSGVTYVGGFPPTIDIDLTSLEYAPGNFPGQPGTRVIRPGDSAPMYVVLPGPHRVNLMVKLECSRSPSLSAGTFKRLSDSQTGDAITITIPAGQARSEPFSFAGVALRDPNPPSGIEVTATTTLIGVSTSKRAVVQVRP